MRLGIWLTIGVIICLSVTFLLTNSVEGSPSPHEGSFALTTTACAGCHRAHTARTDMLLKTDNQYALCTNCHDGTGADTKVTTGVYLGDTRGTTNAGLRGGGFQAALMNTSLASDFNQTGTPAPSTSKHTVGAVNAIAWGGGSSGSGITMAELECANCHNPHGNGKYRNLRPKPTGITITPPLTDVILNTGVSDNYTISYNTDHYRDIGGYTLGITSQMTEWCSQCHTQYKASMGSGSTTTGVGPYYYRHVTQEVTGECMACHVAHGSSANMTGFSKGLSWPGGSSANWQQSSETKDSRLLTIDNRGVCIQCHGSFSN